MRGIFGAACYILVPPNAQALVPTFTWSFSSEPYGRALEDAGRGGRGERWAVFGNKRTLGGDVFVFSVAILYAFADWVDDAGDERACFLEGALLTTRGLSVGRETVLPWFEKLNETSAAPSGFSTHAWCGAIHC